MGERGENSSYILVGKGWIFFLISLFDFFVQKSTVCLCVCYCVSKRREKEVFQPPFFYFFLVPGVPSGSGRVRRTFFFFLHILIP